MINSRDIDLLHPALKRSAIELVKRCKARKINIIITATYRDNEYQNSIYAQGRSKSGAIVTNARGGQSMHNYRLAFDFAPLLASGQIDWSGKDPNWVVVGNIGVQMGLEWGGSWKGFVDKPHFQFTNGLTLSQLQAGKKLPQDCRMKWESEAPKGTEDTEMVDATRIKIEDKFYTMNRILKEGNNYLKISDLRQAGFIVEYDAVAKIPVMYLPKK